ncbi:hypothetical protein G7046_g4648 [Stylonectria norvegica]|nr:hypothetical protein G7046_g4648 [Stylonectria norvegica]
MDARLIRDMDARDIVPLAEQITTEATFLEALLQTAKPDDGNTDVSSTLWEHSIPGSQVEQIQTRMLGLVQQLNRALRGSHDFLSDFVASNWDKGALYCLLDHHVFEHIPLDGGARPSRHWQLRHQELATQPGVFRHGLVSRELTVDPGLRAFIGFQLYETRVASAHLSDSLSRPNEFWTGKSAFEHAWGQPMYAWHRSHPEKEARFAAAMQTVGISMDPGNRLLKDWFTKNLTNDPSSPSIVLDIGRRKQSQVEMFSSTYPQVNFKVYGLPDNLETLQVQPREDASLLKHFATALDKDPHSVIIVNDLLSPLPGKYSPRLDKAFRRRDVTVMTMHNAKLRTEEEWMGIFQTVNPTWLIEMTTGFTSHSCRGNWEIRSGQYSP